MCMSLDLFLWHFFSSKILGWELKKEILNNRLNGYGILMMEIFNEENSSEIFSYVRGILPIDSHVKTTYINNWLSGVDML